MHYSDDEDENEEGNGDNCLENPIVCDDKEDGPDMSRLLRKKGHRGGQITNLN